MPKSLEDNSVSNSKYHGQGIFTDRCKIISVEDLSNYPKRPGVQKKTLGEKGWEPELCLRLVVNSGMEMSMNVLGNYNWKTDPISGKKLEYLGWKQRGNAVQNLIVKLGLGNNAINDDDTISQAVLNAMPGKEFIRLRYCQGKDKMYEGKPSTQTWTTFSSVYEGAEEDLVAEFKKANLKKWDHNLWEDYQEEQKSKESSFKPEEFAPGEDDII
ncbi:hypothetical protein [Immundisolibacter sp.]